MPSSDANRRSVVPVAAGRSLWLSAVWTGMGAALVCAVVAIVAVAICWLPVSGSSGHSMSAARAGLLTFLAALHGGITVDGVPAQFLPLGMTIIVAAMAWRAGSGLGDAAVALDEDDPVRLVQAGLTQAVSFSVVALFAVPFAHLGTSSAPVLGVATASLVLFLVTGGVAFVRATPLRELVASFLPPVVRRAARAAVIGLLVYLALGALLVAASLVMHHGTVTELSSKVGGGWGGIPILLLGLLAAPNAAIAGASYLAGPGVTVGTGSTASAFTTAHGVLPAFPILGAMPTGHGATIPVLVLIALTPLLAGIAVVRACWSAGSWTARFAELGLAAVLAGFAMLVLAWQGGGAIGDGRLHVIGASPVLAGSAVLAELMVAGAVTLAITAAVRGLRARRTVARPTITLALPEPDDLATQPTVRLAEVASPTTVGDADEADKPGKLAG